MFSPSVALEDIAETIREDHLRIAVLLDTIQDELQELRPVNGALAELRAEYERHTLHEERALAQWHPALLDSHVRDHANMHALLNRLSSDHERGCDIGDLLHQVVGMFTDRLMPADAALLSALSSTRL